MLLVNVIELFVSLLVSIFSKEKEHVKKGMVDWEVTDANTRNFMQSKCHTNC